MFKLFVPSLIRGYSNSRLFCRRELQIPDYIMGRDSEIAPTEKCMLDLTGLTQKIGFHSELKVYRKERAMNCPTTNALTSENEQNA